jgi:Zn finger protein HypA/HybF involved in hydrogenase expression
MKPFVPVFVATLASVGSFAGSSEPKSVALEESFQLKVGECARIEAEALEIGFEEVSSDSRCPKGEQCIWEGDATVRVWLRKASETRETLELHTSPREQSERSEPSYGSYGVELERLDPYPISGKTIPQEDYQATLQVTRGSTSSAASRR